jgi:hypothetical protein
MIGQHPETLLKSRLRGVFEVVIIGLLAAGSFYGLLILLRQYKEIPDNIYYVDIRHTEARDTRDFGTGSTLNRPWRTLEYAFQQLQPGDTLLIRGGVYQNAAITLTGQRSGQPDRPITVKAYPNEEVILRGGQTLNFHGARWWILDGLIFDRPKGQYLSLGLHKTLGQQSTIAAEHIIIRNCEFKNGIREAISINFAKDILIEHNYFHHIRPGVSFRDHTGAQIGWELNAIDVRYIADGVVIKNNRFEEIGSDGVHLGAMAYKSGASIGVVTIIDNEFWVNRPYTGILGNVGENGIDIKRTTGPILISGNKIHGFRPSTPEQDASGGGGGGIAIHNGARNIMIEKNLFYDNTIHLGISEGTVMPGNILGDITIRNNIFKTASPAANRVPEQGFALLIADTNVVAVYHNTFYANHVFLRSWNTTAGIFKNNIIYGGKARVDSTANWEADYNAWSQVNGAIPSVFQGNHDLIVLDLKLDPTLHPQLDSLVINAGQNLGILDDFAGNPRTDESPDLGALEYIDVTR